MTKNVRGFVRKMQEQSLLNSVDGVSHKVHFKSSEKMKEVKRQNCIRNNLFEGDLPRFVAVQAAKLWVAVYPVTVAQAILHSRLDHRWPKIFEMGYANIAPRRTAKI